MAELPQVAAELSAACAAFD